jgi:hypothetical protein
VAAPAVHPLHDQIFERLKLWRRQTAADKGVPAYIVFGDRDLQSVAAAAPRTLAELSACRGIGPTKLKEYGQALLDQVANCLPPQPEADGDATPHFRAGRTVAETAALLGLDPEAVFAQFVAWLVVEPSDVWKLAVRQVLAPDDYRVIRGALQELGDSDLASVHEALGHRYGEAQVRVAQAVMERVRAGGRSQPS